MSVCAENAVGLGKGSAMAYVCRGSLLSGERPGPNLHLRRQIEHDAALPGAW